MIKDPKKWSWAYNIIDGKSEQNKIIYRDDKFILIPDLTWNNKNIYDAHILALVTDKKIITIRSLTGDHIKLLEYIHKTTLAILEKKYKISKKYWKSYFHYYPSTWILHIHFVLDIQKMKSHQTHDFDKVIKNLKSDSNYYQKNNLNVIDYEK